MRQYTQLGIIFVFTIICLHCNFYFKNHKTAIFQNKNTIFKNVEFTKML